MPRHGSLGATLTYTPAKGLFPARLVHVPVVVN